MSHPPSAIWLGSAAAVEAALLCWAATALFHRARYPFAEAAAYGIACTLMLYSFLFQTAAWTGLAFLSPALEAVLVVAACVVLLRGRPITLVWAPLRGILTSHPLPAGALAAALAYLLFRAMDAPSGFGQWPWMWPVLDLQRGIGFCGTETGGSFNHAILAHLVLRHHIRFGLGLFGFLSYLQVGLASYALARRYAWPPTALTASLVVLSAPRLVMHAVTPGVEIAAAAAAVFVLLALYRNVEEPNSLDTVLMLLGIAFCASAGPVGFALPPVLLGLAAVVLYRRHGGRYWWALGRRGPFWVLAALLPVTVFLQPWRLFCPETPSLPTAAAPALHNADGLVGGLANLLRYLLEALHPTAGVEFLVHGWWGVSLEAVAQRTGEILLLPAIGAKGAGEAFRIQWEATPGLSWFGPLAWLLVGPGWLKALVRGPRRLKAVAVALAGYVYLATLLPAWVPGNASLFTPFWCGSGFMVAYLLPPWRLTRNRKLALQALCAALLLWSCWQVR